jgi:hypothetical protein
VEPIKTDIATILSANSDVISAIKSTNLGLLTTGCRALKRGVRAFEADTPAPDAQVRADFARAMDSYSTAATECIATDYDRAGDDLIAGNKWASKATARISALGPG